MMHVLFVLIPRLLFEPIAVSAILGCFAALFLSFKNRRIFYWGIAFSVSFMILWRLFIHSLMASSRYSSILLYPAPIFIAWLSFELEDIFLWLFQKIPGLQSFPFRKICCFIPYVCIIGLFIPCLIKALRYDLNKDHTVRLARTLAGEIKDKKFRLYSPRSEQDRIAYYSGIDVKHVLPLDVTKRQSVYEQLRREMLSLRNFIEPVYFIFPLKEGEAEPTIQYLEMDPSIGTWECVSQEYTSERKNKKLVLYRFVPAHPNIEIWEEDIPAMSPLNRCPNGDFEKILSGKGLDNRIQNYRKRGVSDFYCSAERLFPRDWWLGATKATDGNFAEISLTSRNPLAGMYSMELKSNGRAVATIRCSPLLMQNGTFSGFIRAEKDSDITILVYGWNEERKNFVLDRMTSHITTGEFYRFTIPIPPKKDIPEESKNIFIAVQCSGHILVDNVEFIPSEGYEANPEKGY